MKTVWIILLYLCVFGLSVYVYSTQLNGLAAELHQRLLPVEIKTVKAGMSEEELQQIVLDAKQTGDVLSIAGMQHSQGGQTVYPNGIMIDMKPYNQIVEINEEEKTVTVQSGARWADIQEAINPYGLSLKISQSQNIFTVGGSLSVNAHGLDIRNGGLTDTVVSMRLLDAEGDIVHLSPSENKELFYAVLGGYGLFGIILDVTLELTNDELYETQTDSMPYRDYPAYFKRQVQDNPDAKMHLARISIAPESFMEEMYTITYKSAEDQTPFPDYQKLKTENLVAVPKFFLGLSRINDAGKDSFWNAQTAYTQQIDGNLVSRNNVMRSDSEFMEYDNSRKTEILQEYFVPADQFEHYIPALKAVLEANPDFNLLNVTIRYVGKNEDAVLSYAKEDMFSLVLLVNQGTDTESVKDTQDVVREMIDVTLAHGGSYYLPYFGYPTKEQMQSAYPRTGEFFELKDRFDPDHRFMNLFYEEYRP
ncbi:FAD/FMN-containing dehydrogenase [Planomicrobium stackebrandtii]|uniref:FAD/FMN-containing dehydrogenase n=1 Tax=Planomicrobium stackebrandtii TaxID=253160 RepID=A0ABU0GWY7_9BACL|nr:FAD-binding oxidoreductase [Planomicrobium stackebrandtii]MDQ0429823.1 FAD/FMN-containing dehydrogenase [Planomicrobium stackebrandtii]